MKLQLLVTQYKETDEVVKPLLDSIAIQQSIDFDEIGVIICNDGSDVFLSDELVQSYPYKVEYYREPHRGVSGTRNACLDYATADYVMFCDADDMFLNVCGIFMIFLNIAQGFDSLNSAFIEEAKNYHTGETVYVTHENDATFIHGKVHRRQYLIDKDIRWNERLTIHEDSYFNVQCLNLSEKIKYCDIPFYLWKWRADSVCRQDKKFLLKTYDKLIDSNDALIDAFVMRGFTDKAMFFACNMIFDTYYAMNKKAWIDQENQEFREKTEMRFAEYFKKREILWNNVPMVDKMQVSEQSRNRAMSDGLCLETVTIFEWLENIKEKYDVQQETT